MLPDDENYFTKCHEAKLMGCVTVKSFQNGEEQMPDVRQVGRRGWWPLSLEAADVP